ncbi:unnamed protein product [Lupinus luteus]|uniref:ACB domain-containing protein n=1 Tax=Lupinus luteus TaxID=3873 RepID=A0AAV1XL45_LUPLU
MELLTATNIVLFASLTLLLSFLVAKLVSFSIPHTTTTTNKLNQLRHVSDEPLTVQTDSKVPFQLPTNIETDHNNEEVIKEETKAESNSVALSTLQLKPPKIVIRIPLKKISVEEQCSVEEERDVILDDWEGIERSELEKEFMAVTEFVVGNGSKSVGNDVEMELYGLHKVATEGPSRQLQPMPLMLSARAKWNAWQKLGNMSPEVAMEQYIISLVWYKVPGWIKDTSAELEQEKESSAHDRSPLTEAGLKNNCFAEAASKVELESE